VARFSESSLSLACHILLIKSFTSEVNSSPTRQKKHHKTQGTGQTIFTNDETLAIFGVDLYDNLLAYLQKLDPYNSKKTS